VIRDDSPTAAEVAAAAPPLSPAVRERLRRALAPAAVSLPPRRSRADHRYTAEVAARAAVGRLVTGDPSPGGRRGDA
jgi:hypothetical protein